VSIGEVLAEARRRAGLTVAQVGHQTGISEASITGIEGNDYSACSDDSYARWYIRSIARAVGANPEPLIREYKTGPPSPPPVTDGTAMDRIATDDAATGATAADRVATNVATDVATATDDTTAGDVATDDTAKADVADPATDTRRGKWLWRGWLVVVAVVVGWIWLVMFQYHSAPARAHPVTHRQSGHRTQATRTPTPATGPARTLTPAGATGFGPDGRSQGDNSDLAHLAIDTHPATAWHTDWYSTARFGNLYAGTGLLVDMGRPVTVTAAQLNLGSSHGAGLQLRVGTAPALADLPPVAQAANAGGVVSLQLTRPAHGRYVLIWFTSLPRDPAGTFQASVYSLRLEGKI
jgi:cytoskeletal protein RodZ